MTKLRLTILLMLLQMTGFSQEVRFGMILGTSPLKFVELDWDQYSPSNSYYTYLDRQNGQGLIRDFKPFNAVHIGAVFNASYRKFAINFEPQYFFERSVYRLPNPYEGMERIVGTKAFRMPIYFTYKFFKKENSSYFLAGLNISKGKNWDIQHPSSPYYLSGEEAYPQFADFGD